MNKYRFRIEKSVAVAILLVIFWGCELDISNLNAPTDDDILNSAAGIE